MLRLEFERRRARLGAVSLRRHAPWIHKAIRAGQPFHFRSKTRWRHNAINLTALGVLLGIVAVTVWASTLFKAWLYVPIAAVIFGWSYFSFFILVVHEASHGMFFIFENRRVHRLVNRTLGWMFSVPFATHYAKHWERGHLEHHLRPLEPNDPQQSNTLVGAKLWETVCCNLFIPGFLFVERTILRKRKFGKSTSSKGVIVAFVAFWGILLSLVFVLIRPSAALGLFLGLHVLSAWNHIKGSLEHGGAIGREDNPFLRSRTSLFPFRSVLMPFHITLHFEHHLNFCVPWYDLPTYHRALKEIVPRLIWDELVNTHPWQQLSGTLGGLSEPARASAAPELSRTSAAGSA